MLVYLKQTESTVNEPGSMAEEKAADTAEAKEQITVAADNAEEQGVANVVRKKQSCKICICHQQLCSNKMQSSGMLRQ